MKHIYNIIIYIFLSVCKNNNNNENYVQAFFSLSALSLVLMILPVAVSVWHQAKTHITALTLLRSASVANFAPPSPPHWPSEPLTVQCLWGQVGVGLDHWSSQASFSDQLPGGEQAPPGRPVLWVASAACWTGLCGSQRSWWPQYPPNAGTQWWSTSWFYGPNLSQSFGHKCRSHPCTCYILLLLWVWGRRSSVLSHPPSSASAALSPHCTPGGCWSTGKPLEYPSIWQSGDPRPWPTVCCLAGIF